MISIQRSKIENSLILKLHVRLTFGIVHNINERLRHRFKIA